MKIDWHKYNQENHVISWLLASVIGEKGVDKFYGLDSSEIDVVLTVNGAEVPLMKCMDHLNSQLDAIEERSAKKEREYYEETCRNIMGTLHNLLDNCD